MPTTVGQMIRQLREAQGMSREELARRVNKSPSTVAMLETDATRLAGLETAAAYAAALGVSIAALIPDTSDQVQP